MIGRAFVAAAVAGLVFAADLMAHDTWLLPHSMRIAVGQGVRLKLTSGMAFPIDDFFIDPRRVIRATVRFGDTSAPLPSPKQTGLALQYSWTPSTTGIAGFAIEFSPTLLTLAPDKIQEYFADINASAALRAAWDSVPLPRQWRESYSKHAASYVRVGNPRTDSSWRQPLGMGFEIVPEMDPTSIRVGQRFPVRVLRVGRPVAGMQVGLQRAGETHVEFAVTNAAGRAQVHVRRGGRWLINTTDLRRSRVAGLEWQSDFATLTIETAP